MKQILIPIDFSENSVAQLKYGISLGILTDAEIHVLHIYQLPVISADAFVYVPGPKDMDAMRENYQNQLEDLVNKVKKDLITNINITSVCNYGIPSEQICTYASQGKFDLIVMGVQGSGYLSERLLGSTTTHLFRKSPAAVLGVHKSSHFIQIKNIVLAYDRELIAKKDILAPLVHICNIFDSHIHVLNIVNEIVEFPTLAQTLLENELNPSLPEDRVSYHIIQNEDILEGLKEYCVSMDIDLLAIIPRKHHFLND
ncbi:MAG: universal stress protein [Saprospiraceae bacterium]|nr:universal stress protein [Saprospiraceae bacterium]